MKKKIYRMPAAILVLVALQITMLGGCSAQSQPEETADNTQTIEFVSPDKPAVSNEAESPSEPSGAAEAGTETGSEAASGSESASGSGTAPERETVRQDGERFEETIMLEGMEETVRYEHVKDTGIGFEMDYDYEALTRQKEADRERFISVYDDPGKPQNYLEVSYTDKVVDDAVSSASEELSKEYDIITEQGALEKGGSCTKLWTTTAKSGAKTPDLLQTVYILPAGDGSIVATAHYTIESAEGFGSRFAQMMDTLAVTGRTAESSLSYEQALEAVKKYCFANNPELEAMSGSDDYTIYWDAGINEAGEIVVLYRSYTGAETRYYIDPDTGDAYATELVPGIIDEEQRTDETFNVRDYLD